MPQPFSWTMGNCFACLRPDTTAPSTSQHDPVSEKISHESRLGNYCANSWNSDKKMLRVTTMSRARMLLPAAYLLALFSFRNTSFSLVETEELLQTTNLHNSKTTNHFDSNNCKKSSNCSLIDEKATVQSGELRSRLHQSIFD